MDGPKAYIDRMKELVESFYQARWSILTWSAEHNYKVCMVHGKHKN